MSRFPLPVLLVLVALCVPPPAGAQGARAEVIELVMDDVDNESFFFHLPGANERNPTLIAPAGATVLVRVVNDGTLAHNFHVGAPVDRETRCCQDPGVSETLEFTVPLDAPATIPYWCVLHRAQGMEGTIRVAPAEGVPKLTVTRPAQNAVVPPTFTVEARAENVTLGQNAHIQYIVNGTRGLPGWDTSNTTFKVNAVGSGYHIVRVELVNDDREPFSPPVFVERVVFVDRNAPPEDDGTPTVTTPAADPPPDDDGGFLGTPTPGAALALTAVALAARAWSGRGARRDD